MIGTRLGPYEITARLGEGGMGEVYRATDTELDRQVAIKVLPPAFTEDPERLARFEREAKLLAQLHHPNIASIFGLEKSGGTRALVMELVEGATLAERLAPGTLPLDDALAIARQIAEALEEAHEKGIVHRDLKPQNVKAPVDGPVKVLDFGLAKAMDPAASASGAPSASQLAASPTLTLGATAQGVILGTAAYMSPEQARGLPVDRRADVWAFGVVLYEMLTGEALFAADTVPDTLARVLTREPDLDRLPGSTPPAVRRLIRRCLVRKPKDRLHSIADARIALDDVLGGRIEEAVRPTVESPAPASDAAPLWRRALPWLAGALAGVAITLLSGTRAEAPVAAPSAASATIRTLVAAGVSLNPSVSPNGNTLAFESTRDGDSQIWIKDLRSGSESVLVRRTSFLPAFSPDGASVLFTSGDDASNPELYRTSLATREERLVARAASAGDWAPDGKSVVFLRDYDFATNGASELVSAEIESGRERVLYRDPEKRLNEPRFSPDGRRIAVFFNKRQAGSNDSIGLLDVESGRLEEQPLEVLSHRGIEVRGVAWLSPQRLGVLLLDGNALIHNSGRIVLLDTSTRELVSLLPLAAVGWGLDLVGSGSLIVGGGSTDQNLRTVTRGAGGRWSAPVLETEGPFRDRQPVYSPDGRFLLFTSNRSGNLDIWRRDRATGELQRLTDHEADDWDPATSPDGKRLLFSSNRSGRFQIWIAGADGSAPRQVTDLENAQNPTMTGDGEWIVFVLQDAGARTGIWRVRPDGSEAALVLAGNFLVPDVSPDGRYAAFVGPGQQNLARLTDGVILETALGDTARYRWTVENGRTYLWVLGYPEEGTEIRRFPFDTASGRLGPREIVLSGETLRDAETFGVAHDGSSITFASLANRRGQLIRIDGLSGLGN